MTRALAVLATVLGLVALDARADIIGVTVTGTIAVINGSPQVAVTGIPNGTPYSWSGTYDTSIASTPFLTNVSVSNALLSSSLTIGAFSWTGQSLRMAIQCCNAHPSSYWDTVAFYADQNSGPSLESPLGTYVPRDFNYQFAIPENVLTSTATPSAAALALVPPSVFDFRFSTGPGGDYFDILGAGSNQQVTITDLSTVPEPATLPLVALGLISLTAVRLRRRTR